MKIAKIALGVLAGALLIVGGAMSTETNIAIDSATSTFTKSTFDYLIVSPSNEQLTTFAANTEAVDSLFPVYNYENTLKATNAAKVNLLLSDKMENYDISFFNPKRIAKGEYSESGLLLDEVAARKLGADVGMNVTFPLGGGSFTLPVAAIYSEVNYQTMANGVAMAKFTTAMNDAFLTKATAYDLTFIAAKDKAKCLEMLKDYKPMGQLATYAEYKAEWDEQRPDGEYTDEEWEARVTASYNAYKASFIAAKHINVVQDKAVFMAGAEDTVSTKKEKGLQLSILFAILVPLVLGGGLVGFDFLSRNRDEAEKMNGQSKEELKKSVFIFDGVAVGAATVISLAGTLIYGAIRGKIFVDSLLVYSLPALVALAIALPLGALYVNLVYGKNKALESEPAAIEEAPAPIEDAPVEEAKEPESEKGPDAK